MEIEVITKELNNLSEYLNITSQELKNDLNYINEISIQLNKFLHGMGQQTLSSRITNFNTTQFSKVVEYTNTLSGELKNAVKIYDSEENSFAEKMQREALKYEDGAVASPILNTNISSNEVNNVISTNPETIEIKASETYKSSSENINNETSMKESSYSSNFASNSKTIYNESFSSQNTSMNTLETISNSSNPINDMPNINSVSNEITGTSNNDINGLGLAAGATLAAGAFGFVKTKKDDEK